MVDRIRGEPAALPCDGCRRGLPRNAKGEHFYESALVKDHVVTLPCTAPEEERATGAYTVGVGGFSPTDTQMMLNASVAALREVLPPTVGIALFLVDVDEGWLAFKRDVQEEHKTLFYMALGSWAQATIARDTRRGI